MGKEGLYVLRGKLTSKPSFGFSYGKTRSAITNLLLTFRVGEKEERLFERVGNVKIEDEKFDVPVRMKGQSRFGSQDEIGREAKICEFIIRLEEHFGIGADREDTIIKKRIDEMQQQGVILVSHFTEFEESGFSE